MPTQLQSKPRIAFDTNMLLAIGQLKVDVVSETRRLFGARAKLVVPKQVLEELNGLKGKGKTMEKDVEIALKEVESQGIELVEVGAGNADQALESMARSGYHVATNDGELRKRIKAFAGKVIYLRQRHFLKAA